MRMKLFTMGDRRNERLNGEKTLSRTVFFQYFEPIDVNILLLSNRVDSK